MDIDNIQSTLKRIAARLPLPKELRFGVFGNVPTPNSSNSKRGTRQIWEFGRPAPGQIELLLDFEWLVPVVSGQIWERYETPPYTTDYLFTRPERFEPLRAENQRGKSCEAAPARKIG